MKKVLVVDDDVDILKLVETVLRMKQYNVLAISQWELVNNSIMEFDPDLILLDISLGGADGRDICRELKSNPATQQIPVVLFSAYADMAKNIEDAKAEAFLSKPFQINDLIGKVQTHVRNRVP